MVRRWSIQEKGREAVRLLEEKVEENPTSLGLWALLTQAYDDASDHEDWFMTVARTGGLEEPVHAEDYLLAAHQLFSLDPAVALKYANRACELWRSPIALLQRGRIKADYAMVCGDLTYADEADRDVKAASLLLDDNSYVSRQKLATPLLLANAYRDSPDEADVEAVSRGMRGGSESHRTAALQTRLGVLLSCPVLPGN